ncbi:hypothetical protein THAOC_03938 [Thalassiosira oceanica]|uniref:Tudor domain-containing protein n=1 Tax=Thalassiosira oceanica TaxID=159749 RepID=K0TA31_THAOC|nr:hypothetical protein THAOC_03938 [Thalassiosira oceanica]|eukprot:EJK74385.1 hypothetical protein THAOC_03938 [Thalassiosira oceanica]
MVQKPLRMRMRLSQSASSNASEVKLDEQVRLLKRFEPGDRVEAKFRGRGRQWYKGTVKRALGDNRFDISYDDGDVDKALSNEFIRPLQEETNKKPPRHLGEPSPRKTETTRPEKAEPSAIPSEGTFHLHQKVEARYHGRGRRFYKGEIVKVLGGNRYDVDYDDGDKDRNLSSSNIRALEIPSNTDTQATTRFPSEIVSVLSGPQSSQRVSAVSGTTANSFHTPIQSVQDEGTKLIEAKETSVSSPPLRNVYDERESRNSLEAASRVNGVDLRQAPDCDQSRYSSSCEASNISYAAKSSVSPQRLPSRSEREKLTSPPLLEATSRDNDVDQFQGTSPPLGSGQATMSDDSAPQYVIDAVNAAIDEQFESEDNDPERMDGLASVVAALSNRTSPRYSALLNILERGNERSVDMEKLLKVCIRTLKAN